MDQLRVELERRGMLSDVELHDVSRYLEFDRFTGKPPAGKLDILRELELTTPAG